MFAFVAMEVFNMKFSDLTIDFANRAIKTDSPN